jgi:predicted esterase
VIELMPLSSRCEHEDPQRPLTFSGSISRLTLRLSAMAAIATSFVAVTGCAQSVPRQTRASVIDNPRASELRELAKWQSRFEAGSFQSRSGMILPYRIATPSVASPRPLVLVLHGSGEMGSDNKSQLTPFAASWVQLHEDSEIAPIIVAPQVRVRSAAYELCGGIRCASRPGPSFEALLQLLDSLAASEAVDSSRIYVVGFSMGGATALQLALARPQLAAAIAVFGAVPPPKDRAPELKLENLLVVQGTRDRNHSIKVMREWIDRLNASGGGAILVTREGMKHQIPDDMVVHKTWRLRLLQQRRDKELASERRRQS